jgi:hypothetical protein
MLETINLDPPETENREYLDTVVRIMSPYKNLDINRDDLNDKVTTQVPDDFRVIYSIKDGDYNNGASLRTIADGKDESIEVEGKFQRKSNGPRHEVRLNIGSLIIEAGFKEQRNPKNPNVKSGTGRISIYKNKENL